MKGWQRAFLLALSEFPDVRTAADAAGVTTHRVYAARRRDPDFRARMIATRAVALTRLVNRAFEAALFERLEYDREK